MECQAGDFWVFDPATCSQFLGGMFSSAPSAPLSHLLMQSSRINHPRPSGCPYATLADFPHHERSPTTQGGEVSGRLAAPLNLRPNGGHIHMSCLVPETFGDSYRRRRVGSMWLRVMVERRLACSQDPLPSLSRVLRATKTGQLGQHITKRSQACIRLLHAQRAVG